MTWLLLLVPPIFRHVGTHEQGSDSMLSLNHKIVIGKQWLRTKGIFFSTRASINSSIYSETEGQWMVPKEIWTKSQFSWDWQGARKEKMLQKILIVFHTVLAFFREMPLRRWLPPHLRCAQFQYHNRRAEEVQERELPSVRRRTTVSLRPRPHFRRCKRKLWLLHHTHWRRCAKLYKILTIEKMLSLLVSSSYQANKRSVNGNLNVHRIV